MFNSLWPCGLSSPWNSPGQNTGVGNLSLLQQVFLTQKIEPESPTLRWIFYQLSYQGSPEKTTTINMHILFFFYIVFHYRLLQNIDYSSSYNTVGPCWFLNSVNWKSLIYAHSCRGQVAVDAIYWLEYLLLWVTLNCSPSPGNFSYPHTVWWKS